MSTSLEEEQLPPSIQGCNGSTVQRAWGEPSMEESGGGGYDTLDSEVYWSREEGRSKSMVEEENEKLKEGMIALRVEVDKYKHLVENRSSPDPAHMRPRPEGSEGEDIISKHESELDIAHQRIEELEQEVLMGKYLLDRQSPNPSMINPSQNGGEHSDLLESTRAELDQKVNLLHSQGIELSKVKGEHDKARSELGMVSEELRKVKDECDVELSKLKGELSEVRRELGKVKSERDEVRVELQRVESKLSSKEAELLSAYNNPKSLPNGGSGDHLHTQDELEETRRELGSTRSKLEEVETTLEETRITLRKKEEELKRAPRKSRLDLQTSAKLNDAKMELREKEKVLGEKTMECEKFRADNQKLESQLEEALSSCQSETQRRIEVDNQFSREKRAFECKMAEQSTTLTGLQKMVDKYAGDLQRKQEEEVELKQKIDAERSVRQGVETRLKVVLEEKDSVKKEKEQVMAEKEQVVAERDEAVEKNKIMYTTIKRVEQSKDDLQSQVEEVEEVCGAFKEEAERTMGDYFNLAERLEGKVKELEKAIKERDKFKNILSGRTAEVKENEKALKTQDEELKRKAAELRKVHDELENRKKIYEGKMEAMEKDTNDSLSAMREQMKIYEEDFSKEREAREKTSTKLGQQHVLVGELQKKIEALEKDKKELRGQLNQQASRDLQEDLFSDEEYQRSQAYHDQVGSPQGHYPRDLQGPYRRAS